ncbi:MAG: hypothetical protein ACO2OO_00420 [Candidatus Aenigmatarchaeota archaeon]
MEKLKDKFEVVRVMKVRELLNSGSVIPRDYVFGSAKIKLYKELKSKGYNDDDEVIIAWRHYFRKEDTFGVYVHILKAFDNNLNEIAFATDYD